MEPAEIRHSASFATAFPYHRHARARAYIRPIWNPLAEVAERRRPCGCQGLGGGSESPKGAPRRTGCGTQILAPAVFAKTRFHNFGEL